MEGEDGRRRGRGRERAVNGVTINLYFIFYVMLCCFILYLFYFILSEGGREGGKEGEPKL